jgi:hypothetical protein
VPAGTCSISSGSQKTKEANERIYNTLWAFGAEDGAFVCECERSRCAEEVVMTPSEYVFLRDRGEIITALGHDGPISLSESDRLGGGDPGTRVGCLNSAGAPKIADL